MSDIRRYLSHDEVAQELGINRERFYRIKRKLERERGFPTSVPDMGYDPMAIKLWQDRQIGGAGGIKIALELAAPALPAAATGAWDEILDRRADALAGAA